MTDSKLPSVDEVSEQKPGRELDALVAEKVMGFVPAAGWFKTTGPPCLPRSYSTDISAAWEVVEKLSPFLRFWMLHEWQLSRQTKAWNCKFIELTEHYTALADTAPHAICLAALKAVEGK